MKEKIKNLVNKGKVLAAKVSIMATSLMLGMTCPVYAGQTQQGIVNGTSDDIFKNFIGQVLNLVTYVGVGLFVWGLVSFFLSIKNDEPEKKQGALMTAVAGIGIIGIRAILTAIGVSI